MIATETAVWESILVVAGGLVAGAVGLSALAKIPGGRWLWKRLVAAPVAEIVHAAVDERVAETVEPRVVETVERVLDGKMGSVEAKVDVLGAKLDQVNHAVNNVGPGAPALKDRVGSLERGQERIHGELVVVREVVESLARRP